MELNISNPIEAIYLNIPAIGQNLELQIMATRVYLSTYLSIVSNLFPFKLFNAEHTNLRSQRNTFFSLTKRKNKKKEWFQPYPANTRNFTLLQH